MKAYQGCILSGIMACLGSYISKFATTDVISTMLCPGSACIAFWPMRAIMLLLMLTMNTLALTTLFQHLQYINASVGFLLNTGANLITSGLFGYLLGESLSIMWIFGTALICIGTCLIQSESKHAKKD